MQITVFQPWKQCWSYCSDTIPRVGEFILHSSEKTRWDRLRVIRVEHLIKDDEDLGEVNLHCETERQTLEARIRKAVTHGYLTRTYLSRVPGRGEKVYVHSSGDFLIESVKHEIDSESHNLTLDCWELDRRGRFKDRNDEKRYLKLRRKRYNANRPWVPKIEDYLGERT